MTKKRAFNKSVVILVILLNVPFTVFVLYIFLRTGQEPITLIEKWFNFTGKEILILGGIKVADTVTGTVKDIFKNREGEDLSG